MKNRFQRKCECDEICNMVIKCTSFRDWIIGHPEIMKAFLKDFNESDKYRNSDLWGPTKKIAVSRTFLLDMLTEEERIKVVKEE